MAHEFRWSLYAHGFVRIAACTPQVRIVDPEFNLQQTLALARRADDTGAMLAVFPELGLSGYTNEDLFLQDALLERVRPRSASSSNQAQRSRQQLRRMVQRSAPVALYPRAPIGAHRAMPPPRSGSRSSRNGGPLDFDRWEHLT